MFVESGSGHGLEPSGECARGLAAEIDRLVSSLVPADLGDESLAALICELERCRSLLAAAQARVLGAWDARMVWAADGAHSGAAWVASHTSSARGAAAAHIKAGRALRDMPGSAAAFESGDIGEAQIRLLVDAHKQAAEQFMVHEEMLVGFAKELRADEFARVVAHWLAHANPDGTEDLAAKGYAQRGVSLHEGFDGRWDIQGRLTADAGEALREVLDAAAQAMHRSDKALADAEQNPSLIRTGAQRRHDALEELAKAQRRAGEHGGNLAVPAVTAVINIGSISDPATRSSDPVGETASGAVITRTVAERFLCDCSLSRVVMASDSTPVDLGLTARLPSPAQRRALAVRYRGCAFPGCDRPPGWTSAHHIVHWVYGGPTDMENLVPLCSYHHHRVHEGGFGVRRGPSGALEFTRPDGSILTVPKHRAPGPGDIGSPDTRRE